MMLLGSDRSVVSGDGTPGPVVAVFGTGLLGRSILDALHARSRREATELALDWRTPASRSTQLQQIEERVRQELQQGARLSVLWSAGSAGFMSSDDETAAELQSFAGVLGMTETFARDDARTTLHLISSAGGLFEGQRHVTSNSKPSPRRPYGHMKLRQEELLLASSQTLGRRVYRVSSAYGYARHRIRSGLVATLILNGLRHQVTHLTGRMDTLRDYVFAGDVASYVAERLLDEPAGEGLVVFLARSRPSSLLEVQRLVEKAHGRKLQVSYAVAGENAADVTFAPEVMPADWHPSDLRTNVGMIYRDALGRGLPAGQFRTLRDVH